MRLIRVGLLLAIFLGAACGQSDRPAPLTVTYVANAGFLIECGEKKILIDALFGGFEADWCHVPPGSIVDLMTAELTVAGVEIRALGTPHEHSADSHRDVEHLEYLFTVGGRVIYHMGDGEMNDTRRYKAYGFGEKPIDLAFACWWNTGERLTFRQQLIHDIIRPERVILMHMLPNRPPIGNPERQQTVAKEVILPQLCLQSWGPWPTQ